MSDDDLRRELQRLAGRWRARADIFSDEDATARRTANLCADEVEELLESCGD